MVEESRIKAIIHGERVGPEKRASFTRTLTIEEVRQILINGSSGRKLLLTKKDDPDDNVVIEYQKTSD